MFGLPRIIVRARLLGAGQVAVGFAACAATFYSVQSLQAHFPLLMVLLSVVFLGSLTLWAVQEGRIRKLVKATCGKVCVHCGHSLQGLEEVDRCPECGKPFVIASVQETWIGCGFLLRKAKD
jgi:hypothetical protein